MRLNTRVQLGTRVTLVDLGTGETLTRTLVAPRRRLSPGRAPTAAELLPPESISTESPVGRAILDRHAGEVVSVTGPTACGGDGEGIAYLVQAVVLPD